MAKSTTDKLEIKRNLLLQRTAHALGVDADTSHALLSIERKQSLRLNPLKTEAQVLEKLAALGWQGMQYTWLADGYTIEHGLEAIRDSQLTKDGVVYIQNAASWLPVLALDPQPDESILDVCAAPGGKTSHIAAGTHNQVHITANDNSRPRLAKLRANLERLGVQDVEYTLFDAAQLVRKLAGRQFDRILLDAPCSGEGLMHYSSDKDFATWSVAHIKRLQQLQKRLLTQAWELLKPGGTLVYSTCTMAPEENEAVIDYLLRVREGVRIEPFECSLPNRVPALLEWNGRSFHAELQHCIRLAPSANVEAFFVCKLQKIASSDTIVV